MHAFMHSLKMTLILNKEIFVLVKELKNIY